MFPHEREIKLEQISACLWSGAVWVGLGQVEAAGAEETVTHRPLMGISVSPALLEPRGWVGNEPEGRLQSHAGPEERIRLKSLPLTL